MPSPSTPPPAGPATLAGQAERPSSAWFWGTLLGLAAMAIAVSFLAEFQKLELGWRALLGALFVLAALTYGAALRVRSDRKASR